MPCSCFELRHIQTKECKRKRPPFQCLQPDMPHCCRLHPLRHCFSQLQPGCLEAAANAARWPRSPPSDSNLLITFKAGNFEAKGLKIMCMYIYIYIVFKKDTKAVQDALSMKLIQGTSKTYSGQQPSILLLHCPILTQHFLRA